MYYNNQDKFYVSLFRPISIQPQELIYLQLYPGRWIHVYDTCLDDAHFNLPTYLFLMVSVTQKSDSQWNTPPPGRRKSCAIWW